MKRDGKELRAGKIQYVRGSANSSPAVYCMGVKEYIHKEEEINDN